MCVQQCSMVLDQEVQNQLHQRGDRLDVCAIFGSFPPSGSCNTTALGHQHVQCKCISTRCRLSSRATMALKCWALAMLAIMLAVPVANAQGTGGCNARSKRKTNIGGNREQLQQIASMPSGCYIGTAVTCMRPCSLHATLPAHAAWRTSMQHPMLFNPLTLPPAACPTCAQSSP